MDELNYYIYTVIGNASISYSGVPGVFTLSDTTDNQTTVILLNPAFAYLIEGLGASAGLAYVNGTVAVAFDLAQGPVEIISYEVFTKTNKTTSDAPYPAIVILDGQQATVKIIAELKPSFYFTLRSWGKLLICLKRITRQISVLSFLFRCVVLGLVPFCEGLYVLVLLLHHFCILLQLLYHLA